MNHRELILSARRKARFAFLSLPEDLQDEIVEGLDGQSLTLEAASALVRERGHSLSHEGIAAYYRALRTERRLLEVNQELARVIGEFAGKPREDALDGLVNLVLATAVSGLASGTVGIRDIDLGRLLKALPAREKPAADAQAQAPAKTLDLAAIKALREQLGL